MDKEYELSLKLNQDLKSVISQKAVIAFLLKACIPEFSDFTIRQMIDDFLSKSEVLIDYILYISDGYSEDKVFFGPKYDIFLIVENPAEEGHHFGVDIELQWSESSLEETEARETYYMCGSFRAQTELLNKGLSNGEAHSIIDVAMKSAVYSIWINYLKGNFTDRTCGQRSYMDLEVPVSCSLEGPIRYLNDEPLVSPGDPVETQPQNVINLNLKYGDGMDNQDIFGFLMHLIFWTPDNKEWLEAFLKKYDVSIDEIWDAKERYDSTLLEVTKEMA